MARKLLLGIAVTVFIFLGVAVLHGLYVFDLSNNALQLVRFNANSASLEGTLVLPNNDDHAPVVLLVHGDGAQDRYAHQGYLPLIHALLKQGVAVFSWDKPGVNQSQGNWLSQTMAERTYELEQAIKQVHSVPELQGRRVGVLGFSQAGWVVPQLSADADIDFIILVGAAINWRQQSLYYTRQRLLAEGGQEAQIDSQVKAAAADFDVQFSEAKATQPCAASPCSRADFERRNAMADARQAIAQLRIPTLVLSGMEDLNVDPTYTQETWQTLLPEATARCLKPVANASHGLLRANLFNYQLPSQWPAWKQALYFALGDFAYSPGVIRTLVSWIKAQECP